MNNLLDHPDKAFDYARLYASSVAAILVFGFRAKDFGSFFYKDFYDFVDQVSQCLIFIMDISCRIKFFHLSGLVLLNQEQILPLSRYRGYGFSLEPGKEGRIMYELSWIRRGEKLVKWLKTDELQATFVIR